MRWSRAGGIRRVAIADFSKNVFATLRACRLAELLVGAVLENSEALVGRLYRDIPVVMDDEAPPGLEGIVLSNVNPAQIDRRMAELTARFKVPVLRLWQPKTLKPERDRLPKPAAA